jgi:hypothetical protein
MGATLMGSIMKIDRIHKLYLLLLECRLGIRWTVVARSSSPSSASHRKVVVCVLWSGFTLAAPVCNA